jgi:hypothetical protein
MNSDGTLSASWLKHPPPSSAISHQLTINQKTLLQQESEGEESTLSQETSILTQPLW